MTPCRKAYLLLLALFKMGVHGAIFGCSHGVYLMPTPSNANQGEQGEDEMFSAFMLNLHWGKSLKQGWTNVPPYCMMCLLLILTKTGGRWSSITSGRTQVPHPNIIKVFCTGPVAPVGCLLLCDQSPHTFHFLLDWCSAIRLWFSPWISKHCLKCLALSKTSQSLFPTTWKTRLASFVPCSS